MYDMTLTVIGNSGRGRRDQDRCVGNKRDQDLIDIVHDTWQAEQNNKPYNREDEAIEVTEWFCSSETFLMYY